MASGLRILSSTGKRVLSSLGRQVLASLLVTCAACVNCAGAITRVCGSDATCNKWCYPWRKDYSQSECCDCPCPERKGLPPGYGWTIVEVSLIGGRQPATSLTTESDFYTIADTGPFNFDECHTSHDVSVFFEREFRNPDGSLNHIDSETQTWTLDATVFMECTLCPAGTTNRGMRVQASVVLSGSPNGINAHYPRYSLNDLDHNIAETTVSCCIASPEFGLLVDLNADVNLPDYYTVFVTSGGVVSWRPKCTDCADAPLQTDSGDPASICAVNLNYAIEYFDGVDWIPEAGTLNKTKLCQWDGGNVVLLVVTTTALDGTSCPDNCNCNKCVDGSAECGGDCSTRWRVQATNNSTGDVDSEPRGTGACPPTGFVGMDGVHFRNLVISFGTTCP